MTSSIDVTTVMNNKENRPPINEFGEMSSAKSDVFSTEVLNIAPEYNTWEQLALYSGQSYKGYVSYASAGRKYVLLGKDDLFPNFLEELYMKSNLHKRCITGKKTMLQGSGLIIERGEGATDADESELLALMKEWKLERVHRDICNMYPIHYAAWVQIVLKGNADTSTENTLNIKKIVVPKNRKMRTGKRVHNGEKDIQGRIKEHYYRNDFSKGYSKTNKLIDLVAWNPMEDEKRPVGLNLSVYVSSDLVVDDYYAMPDYYTESAVDAIITDKEVMAFDRADLANGMNAGYIVTFYREDYSTTDPDKEAMTRSWERKLVEKRLTGAENTNRVILQRQKPMHKDQKSIEITPIPSNNVSDRHKIIDERKNIAILVAHGIVSPELVGVPNVTRSGFANEAEKLKLGYDLMLWNSINEMKQPIENFYDTLVSNFTKFGDRLKIRIKSSLPIISVASDAILQYAFTENEIRGFYGAKDLEADLLNELREFRAKAPQPKEEVKEPAVEPIKDPKKE